MEHDCENHDYPSSDLTKSTDSDSNQDLWIHGLSRDWARLGRKQMSEPEGEDPLVGCMEDIFLPDLMFDTERIGLENRPECFDTNTREMDYLILFLNDEFWDLLCTNTNLYVLQVKLCTQIVTTKSCNSASVPEMKASLGHYVEDGHQASVRELLAGHNFMSFTLFFSGT